MRKKLRQLTFKSAWLYLNSTEITAKSAWICERRHSADVWVGPEKIIKKGSGSLQRLAVGEELGRAGRWGVAAASCRHGAGQQRQRHRDAEQSRQGLREPVSISCNEHKWKNYSMVILWCSNNEHDVMASITGPTNRMIWTKPPLLTKN